jgi:hypothetical protein
MEDEMMEFGGEMYSEEVQSQIKDSLARKNYIVIASGDIEFSAYYRTDSQKEIAKTLNDMIEHFTETEEYEKCSKILKALKCVNGELTTV